MGSGWAVILFFVIAFGILRLVQSTSRAKSLPPGPPKIPLLGNLLQIPSAKAFLQFQKWSKVYGPIISLKLGSQDLVILNSASDVRELLDKRGAIYSSRPDNHIGTDLIARDNTHLLLMPYGKEWRAQRKIYQSLLNINAVKSLQGLQEAESVLTLQQLADKPEAYYDSIRRYSTAVILSSVFGVRGPEFNHPNIQRLYHAQDQFTAILETGATPPVDIFPFFKALPDFLAPWRKWALSIRAEQRQLYFELLQNVKDRIAKGVRRNCFMDDMLLSSDNKAGQDDEHIAYIGGVLMEGGSDTTASTLLSFLMAMIKYPRVLAKAQQEVDQVCGVERSPTFDDIEKLPYMKHCVLEILRWRPVAMGGLPHRLIKDDTYQNYTFSKDTTFLPNTWAIHHDPERYDSPDEFRPERFENSDFGYKKGCDAPEGLRKTYAFGAGRRICPGQHMAENSLIINMAKLVWAFDIGPGKNEADGRQLTKEEIDDSVETVWTNGFLSAPKRFPLALPVRSKRYREVIDEECRQAQRVFQEYED